MLMGSVPILQSGTRTVKNGKNEISGSKRKTVFASTGTKMATKNGKSPGSMTAKTVCGLPGTKMDKKRRKVFIGMTVFMKVYSPPGGRELPGGGALPCPAGVPRFLPAGGRVISALVFGFRPCRHGLEQRLRGKLMLTHQLLLPCG